jgi:ethanolamine utilization protein EutQ
MSRRVHTAEDVLRRAREGATEYVLAPGDRLTPLARDTLAEKGLHIVEVPVAAGVDAIVDRAAAGRPGSSPAATSGAPRLRHVPGVHTMALDPFPFEIHRPQMDVRLRDVVTTEHGLPIAAGVLSLREGTFPWRLDYDEVEYVLEGELHITTAEQSVVGRPGDVIAVKNRPKAMTLVQASLAENRRQIPEFLSLVSGPQPEGHVLRMPAAEDVSIPVQVQLILELCSK